MKEIDAIKMASFKLNEIISSKEDELNLEKGSEPFIINCSTTNDIQDVFEYSIIVRWSKQPPQYLIEVLNGLYLFYCSKVNPPMLVHNYAKFVRIDS